MISPVLAAIRNAVVLALIGWGAWTLWHWQFGGNGTSEMASVAQRSCVDEARSRYNASGVRAHSVESNSNGFVVKGTLTLARGGTAKITCLTNHNGRVTEMIIEER